MSKAFDWAMNETGCDQGYTNKVGGGLVVERGVVVDRDTLNGAAGNLRPVEDVLSEVAAGEQWFCQRTFAIGDVLMLVPVIRWLRANGHRVYMRTIDDMFDVVRRLGVTAGPVSPRGSFGHRGVVLDFVLEKDYTSPLLKGKHRVDIYAEAIGLKKGDLPPAWDWSMDLDKFGELELPIEKPYVVFQGVSSSPSRSLNREAIEWLATAMNCEGVNVAYVGEDVGLRSPRGTEGKTVVLNRKLSLRELFLLMAGARCAATMDSSPLWISHYTKTPVATIFGTGLVGARMEKHPLYREGAVAVELASADASKVSGEEVYASLREPLMKFWEACE